MSTRAGASYALLVAAVIGLYALGCGSGDNTQGFQGDAAPGDALARDGNGGGPDAPGDGSMSSDTGIDAGNDAGNDAGTDAPSDAPSDGSRAAHAGLALAGGAVVCSSPSYKLIATLGQGPAGNQNASSPSYQLRGGLVGATQAR